MTPRIRRKAKASPTLDELARDAVARQLTSARSGRASRAKSTLRTRAEELRPLAHLNRADTQRLFRAALSRACGGDARASERGVLWREGHDEIIVHADRAELAIGDELIVASIPVYTDESGDAEVVIPIVTNPAQSAVGLIAATETKPRGPMAVIDIFGDTLVAVTWAALVEAAAAWAGAAGEAAGHGRLIPAGLSSTKTGLLVVGQRPSNREDR